MKILKVETAKQKKDFIDYEYLVYADSEFWVPPLRLERKKILDTNKNPFYKHAEIQLFLAVRNGKVCGRIAAVSNKIHNDFHKDNVGFFGFFECENNKETAHKLFDAAKSWLKQKGFDTMRGPASPSSNDEFGLLIEGFNEPQRILMTYSQSYYQELIESYGFKKAKDLFSYKMDFAKVTSSDKLKRVAELAKQRSGMVTEQLDLKRLDYFLEKLKYVYNKAWQANWGYVPLTSDELDAIAKDLKQIANPNGVLFGEINGETVGFALALPDYNQIFKNFNGKLFPFNFIKIFTQKKKINWGRIITLGIVPEYQKRGLDAVFYWELVYGGHRAGIDFSEAGWILEDNDLMNRALTVMGGELYKRFRVYDLEIN